MTTGYTVPDAERRARDTGADTDVTRYTTSDANPGPNRLIYSAVVDDFIANPADLKATELAAMQSGGDRAVLNPLQIERMPRNSILATVVSDQGAKLFDKPAVFFPFFSPHFSLPVKPTEQVWVIYERVDGDTSSGVGFWITRRAAPLQVDDINFTHLDRVTSDEGSAAPDSLAQFDAGVGQDGAEVSVNTMFADADASWSPELYTEENDDGSTTLGIGGPGEAGYEAFGPDSIDAVSGDSSGDAPNFPAGGRNVNADQTLPGDEPYQVRIDKSFSYDQFTGEIVPRFSKRCADLVLQGSNNTRIVLGEDRGESSEGGDDGSFVEDVQGLLSSDSTLPTGEGLGKGTIDIVVGVGQAEATAPASTATNTRDYDEVVKTSTEDPNAVNAREGDADFFYDLARIYVSMDTKGDVNFNTGNIDELKTAHPWEKDIGAKASVDNEQEGAFLVAKSRHVRIVSHLNEDNEGTMRLVQLDKDGDEQASICIDDSGNIQIHGKHITIGADNAKQPYLMYDEFAILTNYVEMLIKLNASGIMAYGTAAGSIPVIGAYLGGSPFAAIGQSVLQMAPTISSPLTKNCASKIIFGE